MARYESDREDLMRDATALKRRVELSIEGEPKNPIVGFGDQGFLSIYFDPDSVYHFDDAGRLRRAFVGGHLFRTQETTLARLTRVRTETETKLKRYDLSTGELDQFLETLKDRLQSLRGAIGRRKARIVKQIPGDDPILPDLAAAIERILETDTPLAPEIKHKH